MKRLFILFVCCAAPLFIKAQQAVVKGYETYGKVDKEDLEMKECDFEKDANAEVLFDKGVIEGGLLTRHVRIKIFNQKGDYHGNIRLRYVSYMGVNSIIGLKAETINQDNGKIEIIAVDKNSIYEQKMNKYFNQISFALPAVKAGSIIEYKYSTRANPTWFFQTDMPTRYSEIEVSFPANIKFSYVPHVDQPFFKNEGEASDTYQDKILTNVPSLQDEPYMSARQYSLQRMEYLGTYDDLSWRKLGELLVRFIDFGGQFNRSLTGEDEILKQAKSLRSQDEKIAFIFNQVKNSMTWDEKTDFAVSDGSVSAWNKKTGNSAEINLILYHLLKKAGVDAYPMVTGDNQYGRISPFCPDPYKLSNTIVFCPIDTTNVDSSRYYVLDATNKFNLYNNVPRDQLNTFAMLIDQDNYNSRPIFLENREPVVQSIFINAAINTDGKMQGTAHISSFGYNKTLRAGLYRKDNEKEFNDYLTNNDNSIKINALKVENMEVDSLPLVQSINFYQNLQEAGDDYIYFNTNIFITPNKNPFLKDSRLNDIDFGYHDKEVINCIFKIPQGYKIEAMPQSISMTMPDGGITFRRVINAQDGVIAINYIINYKKSTYFKEDYADFHEFFKKMYEMLNEQIVLKKS